MTYKNAAASKSPPQLGNRAAIIALTFLAITGVMIASPIQPAAGQSKPPETTAVETPTVNGADGKKATFLSRVHDEMIDWTLKMHMFNERTEAQGKRQISTAEARLQRAWDNTEVKARNVQAASARDWERAKKSYESATGEMKKAWDKAQPWRQAQAV